MPHAMIDELQNAVAGGDIARRAAILRRVTDLFASGANEYSDAHVALFGDVMRQLVAEIDEAARAELGRRMLGVANAPPCVMRLLALDDAIDVAGPVLTLSAQLDEQTLVEGARTKSQEHLLAISRRDFLSEAVTDVLVDRGSDKVVASTAANAGASFSDFGYARLVGRSERDSELALLVWKRADVPRALLVKLFAKASETLRLRLEAADPDKASLFRDMVARASEQIQGASRSHSAQWPSAQDHVRSLWSSGALSEAELLSFARARKFDEVTIALALMSDVPVGIVERAVAHERAEQLMIIVKAIGLSWDTVRRILLMHGTPDAGSSAEVERCYVNFSKLQVETARKALQFHRLRERAGRPAS